MTLSPDALAVVVRALSFVALFQAAGAAFFLAVFGSSMVSTRARDATARLARASACAGIALVLTHLWLDAARMAGDFSGLIDPGLLRLAGSSSGGLSQGVQLAGLALVAVAWIARDTPARAKPEPSAASVAQPPAPARSVVAAAGALIAVGAFTLTGHTDRQPLRPLLAALLLIHLLVVAFWFGSLWPLRIVTREELPAAAARIVRRFSMLATWLVPLIGLAGVSLAALLAGRFGVVRTPYGELLLGKLAVFVLLLVLAGYNKWRLTPALAGASAVQAAQLLRRSVAAEYLLIVAVLCATDVLTTFYSPR